MSCEFCERFDFSTAKIEVDKYSARILLTLCNTKFSKEEQFNFCPVCGRDMRKGDEGK
jgi:Zn finger protein HypA/HybF involved in hydrogenase expression